MNDTVKNAMQAAAKVMSATGDESGGNWILSDDKKSKVCKDCGVSFGLNEKHECKPAGKSLDVTYAKSMGLGIPDDQLSKLLAVKTVGTNRIFHYAFLWGNPNVTDIEQEYFTKSTDLWDKVMKGVTRPLTWDHAMDLSMKADPVIGKTLEYGDDDLGRWAISQLDTAHAYRAAIDMLIEAGVLGSSSDSAPQYVEKVQTGKSYWLKTWPWFATALTVTPCEPRMVETVDYFKSIGIEIPNPEAPVSQTREMVLKARRIFTL
jgi:hypothetical protein